MSNFAKKLKSRRAKKEVPEMNITSLLDILTVLLLFLIRNYNTTDLNLDVIPGISLPVSTSVDLGSNAIIIQVNKNRELFIDNKLIATLDATGKGMEPLEKILAEEAKKQRAALALEEGNRKPATTDTKQNKQPLKVNLVFDKELPYEIVGNILHHAATSELSRFKFIVQGKTL